MLHISQYLPITDPTWIFFIVLCIILFAPIIMGRLRIPHIIGMILAGIIIGPHGFNILENDSSFKLFGNVGLYFIMLLGGLEMNMVDFRNNRIRTFTHGILAFTIPMTIGFVLNIFVLKYGVITSVLLASMYASHTLIAYPIVMRYGLSQQRSVTIAVGATAITDTLTLIVLAIVSGMFKGNTSGIFGIIIILKISVAFFFIIFFFPRIARRFFQKYENNVTQFIFVLAMTFMGAGIMEIIGMEGLLGAFLTGLVLNRYIPKVSPLMNHLEFIGNALFIPYLLIGVGMMVNIKVLFNTPLRHRYRDVRPMLAADALHDHIDDNARGGQFVERPRGKPRLVGQSDKRHPRLRFIKVNALDNQFFHALKPGDQFGRAGLGCLRGVAVLGAMSVGWGQMQVECRVNRSQGLQRGVARHDHRNLDLAGRNHVDVDSLGGQGAEHRARHAGLRDHAQADHRNLRHVFVIIDALGANFLDGHVDRPQRAGQLVLHHGEREIGPSVGRLVLHDHVDCDVAGRHFREDAHRGAGPIGHAEHGHAGLVLRHRRAANRNAGRLRVAHDHRARIIAETAPHVDRHVELFGELDRAIVHDSRARRGQFEHLVVADLANLPGLGHDARIGRVNAVHVGVNFAGVGL